MGWLAPGNLEQMISTYGSWVIAVIVGLESLGLPLPGETVLVVSAVYAARHALDIRPIVAAAALGAILGDNAGYWPGRSFGYEILPRYGPRIGISDARIKLGQYLFLRHGGKVVFWGRLLPFFARWRHFSQERTECAGDGFSWPMLPARSFGLWCLDLAPTNLKTKWCTSRAHSR